MADKPTLYLIDGHAQMFRAFFAIRSPMTSPVTGEPTNATFAFAGMLLKLFENFQPTHAGMATDPHGPTFRHELFPDYKGTRDEPPETFLPQIPRMLEVCAAFGVPLLEVPTFEADDVMATLAARFADDCGRIRLVSKDKDLQQCLRENVTLFDIHKDEELDLAGLREKKGIDPSQAIDLQVLTGDNVDNIPGVKGVGDKTAVKLLAEFGSVERLLAGIEQVKGKRRENIEAAAPNFDLARTLVTLREDVPIDTILPDLELAKPDADKLVALFKELGFNKYQRDAARLFGAGSAAAEVATPGGDAPEPARDGVGFGLFAGHGGDAVAAPDGCTYESVTTTKHLKQIADQLAAADVISVDTETLGLGSDTGLAGVCLAWEPGHAVYIPTHLPEDDEAKPMPIADVVAALTPALTDPAKLKVAHNLKYDWQTLRVAGLTMTPPYFDTMIAAFLTGQPGLKMDDLSQRLLQRDTIRIEQLIGEKQRGQPQRSMGEVPLAQVTPYAAEDADVTLQLFHKLSPELDAMGMASLATDIEMPLVEVLARMENAGITVDAAVLRGQEESLQERIVELRRGVIDAAGVDFNPDSPKQLSEVLFDTLGLPPQRKTKTGYSTDSEVLETLSELQDWPDGVTEDARRVPGLILEYRQLTKLVGTYLVALREAIADDGRVHCRFHQTGAATGRLSSSDPNLQNIPIRSDVGRDIRKAFVAADGCRLVVADYSQIELRMLAHLSEDAALIEAFHAGADIHTAVAAQTFGVSPDDVTREQRGSAKMINFGIVYGITAFGLARRLGIERGEAQRVIDGYKTRFPGINTFLEECVAQAQSQGYVTTILGRRRAIEQANARNPQQRALGERLAINSVVQGSAADLIKKAMVGLDRRIAAESLPLTPLLQVHDELVCEAPAGDAEAMGSILTGVMEAAMELKVPLRAASAVGVDWFSAK